MQGRRGKDMSVQECKDKGQMPSGTWASKIAFSWNIDVGIQSCRTEDFLSAAAIPEGGTSFLSCLLLFPPVSEEQ